jgi:hypothetical protein
MASELVVPVARVKNLREHPNAALLCLADVLGYQMVLPLEEKEGGSVVRKFVKGARDEKGKRVPFDGQVGVEVEEVYFTFKYAENDLVVYFPADTLLPAEWADKFGVKAFLRGKNQDRVGRISLRGEPSFGLVVSLPDGVQWQEGDNVADYYGCKKYEPPIRATAGDAAAYDPNLDPFVQKYTDIQNGRIFVDLFADGEEVVVTEKIHGCFRHDAKVMLANGEERLISELKPGTSVLTVNEKNGRTETKKVLSVLVQKTEDSKWMRLFFVGGKNIVCTEEHLFLTTNGWVKAVDLTEDDTLVEPDL